MSTSKTRLSPFPTPRTAILYYNKGLYPDVGMTVAPKTLEELNGYAKTIYEKPGGKAKGIGYTIEANYYQLFLLAALNEVGFMDADGMCASCQTDVSMEQFLNDWFT